MILIPSAKTRTSPVLHSIPQSPKQECDTFSVIFSERSRFVYEITGPLFIPWEPYPANRTKIALLEAQTLSQTGQNWGLRKGVPHPSDRTKPLCPTQAHPQDQTKWLSRCIAGWPSWWWMCKLRVGSGFEPGGGRKFW